MEDLEDGASIFLRNLDTGVVVGPMVARGAVKATDLAQPEAWYARQVEVGWEEMNGGRRLRLAKAPVQILARLATSLDRYEPTPLPPGNPLAEHLRSRGTPVFRLPGGWEEGLALEHSTAWGPEGTPRPPLAELVNQLKYHTPSQPRPLASQVAEAVAQVVHLRPWWWEPSQHPVAIVPIPPSTARWAQPVELVAMSLGEKLGVLVDNGYLRKLTKTPPMKDVPPEERQEALKGAFAADRRYARRPVLLFDHLYDTGSTLREAERVLREEGQVSAVYVVTVTKNRTIGALAKDRPRKPADVASSREDRFDD
jgi:predicted amidophosphoribosyltransferase